MNQMNRYRIKQFLLKSGEEKPIDLGYFKDPHGECWEDSNRAKMERLADYLTDFSAPQFFYLVEEV